MIRDWQIGQAPEVGAWRGIPFGEYRDWPGTSKSFLARARGGYPAEWKLPVKPTAAMALGSAVDCLIYQGPGLFRARYPEIPEGRKKDGSLYVDYLGSVPGKAWLAEQEAEGRTVLPADARMAALDTAHAVLLHPLAGMLIAAGAGQVSLYWGPEGARRKGRPDTIILPESPRWPQVEAALHLPPDCPGVIVDLKTSGPSRTGRARTPREWASHAYSYGYHLQMGWYAQGAAECVAPGEWQCVLIQATTAPTWPVEVHAMDSDLTDRGLFEMEDLEQLYYQCQAGDYWPNTLSATEPHRMRLERWMTREEGF